jgi:UDP-N-acetylglucosamine--N-acetylmuramyl-(pentapeptide) pyrophosphoryl-undecaprenol N-acetylglucosamine transferase
LRRADPDGDVLLIGRRGGMEEGIVSGSGLQLETLAVRGIDLGSPLHLPATGVRIARATVQAGGILSRFKPDVVVGAAGYVSVPVVAAALLRRIPVVLLEQNAAPGRATRMFAKRARAVAASFAETATQLDGARVVHTGNPVRPEVIALAGAPLHESCEHVLVMGGSQGARRLNDAVAGSIRELLSLHPQLRVTHQCGARDAEWAVPVRAGLPDEVRERYTVSAFFDDIAERIRDADLVVMRAGGSSLAEVTVLGRPMILVPYPYAGAHQVDNAMPYVAAGAAVLIRDEECGAERFRGEISRIVDDLALWRRMAAASRDAGHPGAGDAVVGLIREAAQSGSRSR